MKKNKLINLRAFILAGLFSAGVAKAQQPLYAGYAGPNYALQSVVSETNGKIRITEVGATFRKEIPVWAYAGISCGKEGISKPFYGVGPVVKFGRIHVLPTIEGYDKNLTGVSVYSTVDIARSIYTDIIPQFNKNLDYTRTQFNIYADVMGFIAGASSELSIKRLRDIGNIDARINKYWKNCNAGASFNPRTKNAQFAFQVLFR